MSRRLFDPYDDDSPLSLQPDWPDADQTEMWSADELRFHSRLLLIFGIVVIAVGVGVAAIWPRLQIEAPAPVNEIIQGDS